MEDDLQWKTSSNERRPPMEDNLQWKMTYNGRRPQNIKRGISQHPLYGSWLMRGKLEENPEEISSVALLSPTCFNFITETN
jgi:hypothetical protein